MTAPKGKHLFGTVKVGEKGQIVIPKDARELFGIQPGDSLVVLGDEASGIAIVKNDVFLAQVADAIFQQTGPGVLPDTQIPQDGAAAFEEIRGLASKTADE